MVGAKFHQRFDACVLNSLPVEIRSSTEHRGGPMTSLCEKSNAFDLAPLLSRCMGNRELAIRLLNTFAASLPKDLQSIQGLSDENQYEQVAKIAHRLKGSSANLGAVGVYEAATQLEKQAKSPNDGPLAEWIERLTLEAKNFVRGFAAMSEVET